MYVPLIIFDLVFVFYLIIIISLTIISRSLINNNYLFHILCQQLGDSNSIIPTRLLYTEFWLLGKFILKFCH